MNESARILVIDDNEDDRLLYKRCLQRGGDDKYSVCEAANGEDGLALIDAEPFACVLLDYSLPGRNGVEILKRIRAKHAFVPVVMLTGLGNEKVAVAAMQEGAQNYILKGTIDPQALTHVVKVAIQHCRMQDRIYRQQESLNILSRALAHDLQEPVRTIRTLLEIVAGDASLDPKLQKPIQSIRYAAEWMTVLIDAIHTYVRLDSAEKANLEMCDASDLVEAAKSNIGELMSSRQAVVKCPVLPRIAINRAQGVQIFQNLLSNSIQNCATTPRIDIAVDEAVDHWLFRISDNGSGVAAEDAGRLFDPFKRLSHHDKRGPGLGLATCRKILELHGGKIWFEPALGGSQFLFNIPKVDLSGMTRDSGASLALTKVRKSGGSQQIATVLLVDDDDMALELIQIQLIDSNRLQCRVVLAQDGQQALVRLRDGDVDLVLLDINMPRMDGFELLERMRAENMLDRVAVVMCSTSTYDADMSRAKALGASGYLTKPPDLARLASILAASTDLKIVEDGDVRLLLRAA